ncbi:MAG: glycosyltransferase family 4 protein [Candidatus Marinimicrobia bacterium]|nr:glycosyltransferase family 4 protein [Candidatus Neomarinimicrobiota bacterium]
MIAVVTCGHYPDDERIYEREIKTLLKAGYKITYFTRWKGDNYLSEENLWHRNYSQKDISVRDYTQGILKDFKVLKPSVIHIHEFELLPLAKKVKKLYNTTIIYDVHEANIELWDVFSSKPAGLKQFINKSLDQYEKGYLKSVDYVFTTTPELVNRYEKRGVKSVFIPNYPIALPKRSKKSAIPTIIYHGQISLERGIEDLISSTPSLVKKGLSFIVDIYGSERISGTVDKLNGYINELNLKDIITIHNQLPHNEMLKTLSKAHIAIIPFRDYPMFQIAIPVKMFEAMWARCGIIASDLDSIREYSEGFIKLYPPGDVEALSRSIERLLINDEERKRIGIKGSKLIKEKYNWAKVESILLNIYKKVAS